uniref:Tetratricopeptide repeat protein 36 n=1 Tax=Vombatus ursinus TaxID=29139 RepID=A0A4X2K9L1_VOMUR
CLSTTSIRAINQADQSSPSSAHSHDLPKPLTDSPSSLPPASLLPGSHTLADDSFPGDLLEQAKNLELQGVTAAEAGNLSTALERFRQAINLLPGRASAYNNRAQARRLQGDVAGALEDLDHAILLSRGQGQVACQSYVQRGLVARLQGRDDDARSDFQKAAGLGSPFARRQLVLLNPYAALCNRMLADMMRQLQGLSEP